MFNGTEWISKCNSTDIFDVDLELGSFKSCLASLSDQDGGLELIWDGSQSGEENACIANLLDGYQLLRSDTLFVYGYGFRGSLLVVRRMEINAAAEYGYVTLC